MFGEEGEHGAFSPEERSRLVYLAVRRSRVPILVGVGSPALEVSAGLARDAADAGAAGVLVPPPLFQRCDTDDLTEFYTQFAKLAGPGNPILIYRTLASTSEIPVETALQLLETDLFAGIDDAGADPQSFGCLKAIAPDRPFELLGGADTLFLEARLAGYPAVSALGCAVPELAVALDRAVGRGAQAEIDRLAGLFREFFDWVARFPPQVIVKTAAGLRGLKTGPLPVPLPCAKQKLLEEFRNWFRSWLPFVKSLSAHA